MSPSLTSQIRTSETSLKRKRRSTIRLKSKFVDLSSPISNRSDWISISLNWNVCSIDMLLNLNETGLPHNRNSFDVCFAEARAEGVRHPPEVNVQTERDRASFHLLASDEGL